MLTPKKLNSFDFDIDDLGTLEHALGELGYEFRQPRATHETARYLADNNRLVVLYVGTRRATFLAQGNQQAVCEDVIRINRFLLGGMV